MGGGAEGVGPRTASIQRSGSFARAASSALKVSVPCGSCVAFSACVNRSVVSVLLCSRACARTLSLTRTHIHAHTRTHTHARTHARTHMHTHTHAHTQTHRYHPQQKRTWRAIRMHRWQPPPPLETHRVVRAGCRPCPGTAVAKGLHRSNACRPITNSSIQRPWRQITSLRFVPQCQVAPPHPHTSLKPKP
jgi:hypothetical protein